MTDLNNQASCPYSTWKIPITKQQERYKHTTDTLNFLEQLSEIVLEFNEEDLKLWKGDFYSWTLKEEAPMSQEKIARKISISLENKFKKLLLDVAGSDEVQISAAICEILALELVQTTDKIEENWVHKQLLRLMVTKLDGIWLFSNRINTTIFETPCRVKERVSHVISTSPKLEVICPFFNDENRDGWIIEISRILQEKLVIKLSPELMKNTDEVPEALIRLSKFYNQKE